MQVGNPQQPESYTIHNSHALTGVHVQGWGFHFFINLLSSFKLSRSWSYGFSSDQDVSTQDTVSEIHEINSGQRNMIPYFESKWWSKKARLCYFIGPPFVFRRSSRNQDDHVVCLLYPCRYSPCYTYHCSKIQLWDHIEDSTWSLGFQIAGNISSIKFVYEGSKEKLSGIWC